MVNIPSHDWIQTSQIITLIFYYQDILSDSIRVNCKDTNCTVTFKSADVLYEKAFENLKKPITYLTHNLSAKKLEVTLCKLTPGYWNSLYKLDTSCIDAKKNRDKNFELIDSEPENTTDEPFMKLLKDIYSKGDEETRRAMNKSFQTSGGKVLSTNWNAVKDNS